MSSKEDYDRVVETLENILTGFYTGSDLTSIIVHFFLCGFGDGYLDFRPGSSKQLHEDGVRESQSKSVEVSFSQTYFQVSALHTYIMYV